MVVVASMSARDKPMSLWIWQPGLWRRPAGSSRRAVLGWGCASWLCRRGRSLWCEKLRDDSSTASVGRGRSRGGVKGDAKRYTRHTGVLSAADVMAKEVAGAGREHQGA